MYGCPDQGQKLESGQCAGSQCQHPAQNQIPSALHPYLFWMVQGLELALLSQHMSMRICDRFVLAQVQSRIGLPMTLLVVQEDSELH